MDDAKVEEGEKGEEDGGAMEKGENGAIERGKGFVLLCGKVEEFIEFEMVFVVDVAVGSMMDRMVEHPVGRGEGEDAVKGGQDTVRCTIGKIGFMQTVVENDKGAVELEGKERDEGEIGGYELKSNVLQSLSIDESSAKTKENGDMAYHIAQRHGIGRFAQLEQGRLGCHSFFLE